MRGANSRSRKRLTRIPSCSSNRDNFGIASVIAAFGCCATQPLPQISCLILIRYVTEPATDLHRVKLCSFQDRPCRLPWSFVRSAAVLLRRVAILAFPLGATRDPLFDLQCRVIVLLALSSHARSLPSASISEQEKNLWPFCAGSPNGFSSFARMRI